MRNLTLSRRNDRDFIHSNCQCQVFKKFGVCGTSVSNDHRVCDMVIPIDDRWMSGDIGCFHQRDVFFLYAGIFSEQDAVGATNSSSGCSNCFAEIKNKFSLYCFKTGVKSANKVMFDTTRDSNKSESRHMHLY